MACSNDARNAPSYDVLITGLNSPAADAVSRPDGGRGVNGLPRAGRFERAVPRQGDTEGVFEHP